LEVFRVQEDEGELEDSFMTQLED